MLALHHRRAATRPSGPLDRALAPHVSVRLLRGKPEAHAGIYARARRVRRAVPAPAGTRVHHPAAVNQPLLWSLQIDCRILHIHFTSQLYGSPHTIDWGLLLVDLLTERSGRCTMATLKACGEAERKRSAKVGRRMVARATGRPLPVVSATHAHSRHQSKDHIDASVARRGALPWPARPRGIAHNGIAVSIALVAAVASGATQS